ncbi:zinc finger homeobox protein 4-like protein [Dermatophagoides farinae]|uniref:Zinc finger homeobox protein 4-like protein n=1 Tax=Dermatophagoides farinae TaxID=6954 RepID=A0A9D4SD46_DERFA|nr:zinc finger homeobox protein 4-like protein [Dermatophagoides farinae]
MNQLSANNSIVGGEPITNMITADQLANMNQLAAAANANNLVQLLPNLSPNSTPAEIAAANQMAAHIQFSQLLMSMGLAGMAAGMPMPPGMNVPFAAAAAMGIPPQLIPVMMADPMMAAAAAFNNPALAAAAAAAQLNQAQQQQQQQQQQVTSTNNHSTPGTPSPAPTTPVMPIQTPIVNTQTINNQKTAAVAAAAAAAAAAASVSQQQKRARTRISDEQLKVLRQYFDINNSPTEEQLIEMSQKSGLPMKVIKHWFRNTLFKERQRNKDSPYNFNNPPSTFLNLDEYEKTGEAKVFTLDDLKKTENPVGGEQNSGGNVSGKEKSMSITNITNTTNSNNNMKDMKPNDSENTDYATSDDEEVKHQRNHSSSSATKEMISIDQQQQLQQPTMMMEIGNELSESSMSSACESINNNNNQSVATSSSSLFAGLTNFNHASLANHPGIASSSPLQFALDAAQRSQLAVAAAAVAANQSSMMTTPPPNVSTHSSSGKRANRTRFTDYQIKVLQEFFESNAYPKDDDLEYLSKLLNLSPRVIVVWFQNARQKARKVYENQPPTTPVGEDDGTGRFQRTPGLNYQCKKCLQVFQRYYELIKHQKSSCFKDENPLAAQIRMAAEARAQATSPNVSTSRDSTSTPIDCTRSSTATPEKIQLNLMTSPNSTVASPSSISGNTTSKTSPITSNENNQTFRCDKCPMVFNRLDLWRDHQIVHIVNSNLFQATANPFGLMQQHLDNQSVLPPPPHQQLQQQPLQPMTSTSPQPSPNSMIQSGTKRKIIETPDDDDEDDEESRDDFDSMSGNGNNSNSSDQTPRDKRLRTTILPEQLDYLYQKYQIDSNPSRKMLESIAKEVGLKKRVVQVWFQNTRARERKGQFRAHQQVIHKRCPFCRALFKARSALESHLATRHADQYTKGDINIDNLPDGDPSEDGDGMPDIGNDGDNNSQMADVMKRYEDSFKKYLDELNIQDIANIFVHLQEKMAVNCPQSSPSR